MLPVSDLLEVARGEVSSESVGRRVPGRFASDGRVAVVVWNVCMHCNMSCPHCYAAAVRTPSPTDLSREEALGVVEQLAAAGVGVLILSGGEPLLRPDLFELAARGRELGLAVQLSTNGTRIDAATARRLGECGVQYVGVSIDGLPGFNDAYRGLDDAHALALQGLANARAAGLRTGLRMTLTSRNRDQLGDMLDLCVRERIDRFYVSHLVYSGRGFRIAEEDLDRGQARAALFELFEAAEDLLGRGERLRVVTGSNDSDGVLLLRFVAERHGPAAGRAVRTLLHARGGNSAGEKILNIDSRGRVHPDQFWRGAVLGDLRKGYFADALEHPLREQLRTRLERLKGRCGTCAERELCRGSHRERALAATGDPWQSDPACVMEDAEIGLATADRAASGA